MCSFSDVQLVAVAVGAGQQLGKSIWSSGGRSVAERREGRESRPRSVNPMAANGLTAGMV